MQEDDEYNNSIEHALAKNSSYSRAGYFFLREVIKHSLSKELKENKGDRFRNQVSGKQIAEDFRECALKKFGPMAFFLMEEWGIESSCHVGEMIFILIEIGVLGANKGDSIADFEGIWHRKEAFENPYLPPSMRGSL